MNETLTFGDYLRATQWMIPSSLLAGEDLERLIAAANRLPLCAIDHRFGFEFSLDSDTTGGDFAVSLGPDSNLAEHLIRTGKAAPTDSPAAKLATCLAQAKNNDPASLLSTTQGGLILEYDVASAVSEDPAPPGIFFFPIGASIESTRDLLGDPARTVAGLWEVAGWNADDAELDQVRRVYEHLSSDALVGQAGVLPGRNRRAIRLVVHRIGLTDLSNLLERLRWPGSVDVAMSVIEHTRDLTHPYTSLSLDVTAGGISPRLGIELFVSQEKLQMDQATWSPLIDRLADRTWCSPDKAAALKEWTRTETAIALGEFYRVFQHISHLKTVLLDDRIAAKAYAATLVQRFGR